MLYSQFDEGTNEYNYEKFYSSDSGAAISEEERAKRNREYFDAKSKSHPLGWHLDELTPHFSVVMAKSYADPVLQPEHVLTFMGGAGYNHGINFLNLAVALGLSLTADEFAHALKAQDTASYAGASGITCLLDYRGESKTAEQMRWYNMAKNCYYYIHDEAYRIFKLCEGHLPSSMGDWKQSPFAGLKVWQIRKTLERLDALSESIKGEVTNHLNTLQG